MSGTTGRSLHVTLLTAMVVPALLLALLGLVGLGSVLHLGRSAERILAENYRSIRAARAMGTALNELETCLRYPVVCPEGSGAAQSAFDRALLTCVDNVTEAEEPDLLAQIRTLRSGFSKAGVVPHEAPPAAHAELPRSDPARFKELRTTIDRLIAVNEAGMFERETTSRLTTLVMTALVGLAALVGLFALVFFARTAARRIAEPVLEVATALHKALGPPDEGPEAPWDGRGDELTRLRREMEALLERLQRHHQDQSLRLQQVHHSEQRRYEETHSGFIAMLSHQLKTPLTTQTMAVNLLKERLRGLDPESSELLEHARQSCAALHQLVAELIDTAREPAPHLSLRPSRVDLVGLLRQALQPLQPQAREKGQTLHDRLGDQPAWARVDPIKFSWVVTNAVGNALRYTPTGGRVEVLLQRGDHGLELLVVDTGIGIPTERLRTIFQPAAPDELRTPGSHGLGLSIAKEIMDAHGGEIGIESHPGRGTTVRLVLPDKEVRPDEPYPDPGR